MQNTRSIIALIMIHIIAWDYVNSNSCNAWGNPSLVHEKKGAAMSLLLSIFMCMHSLPHYLKPLVCGVAVGA